MFGENLDNAREGTWPVQGALRPTHNFDPVDIIDGQISEIKRARQTLIDRDAIEQDLRVLAAQSAGENRRQLAGCSGLNNGQPRHFAERITDALDLFLLEIFRSNHAHAGWR